MFFLSKKEKFEFNINKDVYANFCVACVRANVNANQVVEKLLKDYTEEHKKGEDTIIDVIDSPITYGRPQKEFWIKGKECDEKEFENYLRQASYCLVDVSIDYKNGNSEKKVWKVNKFTEGTKLNGNLSSGYLRDWKEKGIIGIKLVIE